MLVEKEVISPGSYWYADEATGLPRKLEVTPELTRYWHDQGAAMLSAGLTVPVPYEHDFSAHPMTAKDKLLNNSGWVKEYRLHDGTGKPGDKLYSIIDVQDEEVAKKLPKTIRWTSPWISSFTDGGGRKWTNVISHLALTTRPRIIKQQPFGSVAAALSMATLATSPLPETPEGFCLSRAGRLFTGKVSHRLRPRYPLAFSMWAGGVRLAEDDMPPPKKKNPTDPESTPDEPDDFGGDLPEGESSTPIPTLPGMPNPLQDSGGDVKMEELLCDLLNALGVQMPDNVGESEFKRALYEAAMGKIKELTDKSRAEGEQNAANAAANTTSPAGTPAGGAGTSGPGAGGAANPLIQQEQQPMYMSLEQIQQLPEPLRSVALSMYNQTTQAQAQAEAAQRMMTSLRDAKLKEESVKRTQRVSLLGKLNPKVKADLDAMAASPAMALSLADGGVVLDPMAQTLSMLEKGLASLPALLQTETSALFAQPHPTDAEALSDEDADKLAEDMSRKMGCAAKKAG